MFSGCMLLFGLSIGIYSIFLGLELTATSTSFRLFSGAV